MEGSVAIDSETTVAASARHHKDELRLWLRMLACTTLVEREVRTRLREQFGVTLPRFDLMAQLDRAGRGMTLGELSRHMMVTNGNVTGLVGRLVREGVISRRRAPNDGRAQMVSLTEKGRRQFRRMAKAHEQWIAELFGGLSRSEVRELLTLLARTKASLGARR